MSEQGNLAAIMEARALGRGWAGAVACVAAGRVVTHADVHEGAARVSTLLRDSGVGRGDRVLIVAPDGIELVWAFLAALRLGAVAVPVNPALTEADHRSIVTDADPRAVVCTPDLAPRFRPAPVVLTEDLADRMQLADPCPTVDVAATDTAYAQYTSGTTGPPKAAVHRHGDPLVYVEAFARPVVGLAADDVILSVSKMFFAYGLGNSLFFPLLCGCRAVLHPGGPAAVPGLAAANRVTVLFGVPTFYARLLAAGDAGSYATIRVAVSAGETLTPALLHRVERFLGRPLLDGLGSTEVGQAFVSNAPGAVREGTVGRPLPPYEVAVRDEHGRPEPAGTEGLLWVRGPTVTGHYLHRPATADAAGDGGWLRTGDRASVDADGFVHLKGRVDDMERVGGMAVAPAEIEAVMAGHDWVEEVAVAGVRADDGSTRLEAFVVLRGGVVPTSSTEAELLSLTRAALAPHKVPRAVHFTAALPRTPTGKLRRYVLRNGGIAPGPAA